MANYIHLIAERCEKHRLYGKKPQVRVVIKFSTKKSVGAYFYLIPEWS